MPEKLLDEAVLIQLREVFNSELDHPVEILYFSEGERCGTCEEVKLLLEDVTSISEKLDFSTYDLKENFRIAQQYHVELAPGLVITGRDGDKLMDYGVRFNGIPSGHEFSSLIRGILQVSKRDSGLKAETREKLKNISAPILLKVFVTPT